MMYDVIGDIHGQADKLEALLHALGYAARGRGYRAPAGRQAVFVGDLIDRGPRQLRVLEIVRAMIDEGQARSVMGNHEFNAIGFLTPNPHRSGEFLRANSARNRDQHAAFLAEVGEGSATHHAWVEWFKSLPLFLDLGGIRVVHATWNDQAVAEVGAAYWDASGQRMSDGFLWASHVRGSSLMASRKLLSCGMEWKLPEGLHIQGKGGERHKEVRVAHWRHGARRLHEVALVPHGGHRGVPDIPIPDHLPIHPVEGAPVFIGHHWFTGAPAIEVPKLACLDYSAATTGPLVAYRWEGEALLRNEHFVWVGMPV